MRPCLATSFSFSVWNETMIYKISIFFIIMNTTTTKTNNNNLFI